MAAAVAVAVVGWGAPLRNGAWEKGGGAWGLPACGLAGGGGGRPPNGAGMDGAALSPHPLGMRLDPPPRVFCIQRCHELQGSQPQTPLRHILMA